MPLILPNTIANSIPADGDKLDQNFDSIVAWANQEAVTRDGSTAMTAPLLLSGAPTQPNQAATKAYVDGSVPLGVMWQFAGDTAPTNWMLCRGQTISRATYAALFAVIGTRFGTGDGSTTFALPDMQGQYPIGHNPGGTYFFNGVGQRYGNRNAALAAHTHNGVDHLHGLGGNSGGRTNTHQHSPPDFPTLHMTANPGFYLATQAGGPLGVEILNLVNFPTGGDGADHGHSLPATTAINDRSLVTSSTGIDPLNGNLPPSVSFNFIMKVQ